jgi:MFS family permease
MTGTIPATLIRRFGARANLLIGSLVMALAFLCLARTQGLAGYFAGASLAGLGFTLLDSVPGTYLLARLFPRPSFAIGLYFTIGGLGGAAGPLLYFAIINITHDWRSFWLVIGALVALIGVVAALLVDVKTDAGAAHDGDPDISTERWDLRGALQTRQLALGAAHDVPMMLVYAAGVGIGYGLTFFAASILLLDYYGRGPYLELFSTVNLISTIGAVAPTLAGLTRDQTGGFVPFLVGLAVLIALVMLAVAVMRPPGKVRA